MIKGISSINGLVKVGALAAMLAGSTALYASNPIKKDAQPNQTEIVSQEGAEAIKAATMQNITQTSVPKEHNPKLDATLRKFIETQDDKKYIENIINNVYKSNGTFLGSAIMQHEIDLQSFCNFVFQNTDVSIKNNINPTLGKQIKNFGPKFFKTLDRKDNALSEWTNDIYRPNFSRNFIFKKIPDVLGVHDRITEFVANTFLLSDDDRLEYLDKVKKYTIKKGNMSNVQASSDLIAREIFIMDKLIFNKILTELNVFSGSQFKSGNKTMQDYFNQWMDSVKPDKNY